MTASIWWADSLACPKVEIIGYTFEIEAMRSWNDREIHRQKGIFATLEYRNSAESFMTYQWYSSDLIGKSLSDQELNASHAQTGLWPGKYSQVFTMELFIWPLSSIQTDISKYSLASIEIICNFSPGNAKEQKFREVSLHCKRSTFPHTFPIN